jgi:DNA-binding MarR family transcriptional regulator
MNLTQLESIAELLIKLPATMCRKITRDLLKDVLAQSEPGLGPHHLMILKILGEEEMLSVTEIGHQVGISKSQMTAATNKLIDLSLIERHPDPADRRKVNIVLTVTGKARVAQASQLISQQFKEKLAALSETELNTLEASLKNIAQLNEKLWA